MTYEEQFQAAAKVEKPTDLVVEYKVLEPGQSVVGILISVEEVQNEKIAEPCNRYVIDTDDGPCSVLPGNATDKQLVGKIKIGLLTRFEFVEKIAIQGGAKQLNRYRVTQVNSMTHEAIAEAAEEALDHE